MTSNFIITLIKAIKKNEIVVQNGWDGYRINIPTSLSLKVVATSVEVGVANKMTSLVLRSCARSPQLTKLLAKHAQRALQARLPSYE